MPVGAGECSSGFEQLTQVPGRPALRYGGDPGMRHWHLAASEVLQQFGHHGVAEPDDGNAWMCLRDECRVKAGELLVHRTATVVEKRG